MSQFSRLLRRAGEDWTLTTYVEGAADEYGDAALIPTEVTVRAIRQDGGDPETIRIASGEERYVDVHLFVAADLAGIDKASGTEPMFTSPEGADYTLLGVGRAAKLLGAQVLFLERQRS